MKSESASDTGIKMWKVTRWITNREKDGKGSTTWQRMGVAFIAGMAFTAIMAYVPAATDTSLSQLKDESAVPAPLYIPDFLEPGVSTDDNHPVKHKNYELVYAPLEEAMFSG